MNSYPESILKQINHKSIREFTTQNIDPETFETLMEVARRTATSNGMQATSILVIRDPGIKKAIADICNQAYITRVPLLLIFVADQYRNNRIAEAKGCLTESAGDMDRFFQAFTDTCLAAQNVVNAAESLDMGTFYIGSILNDPAKMIELLKLPKLTCPIVGLGIGYPNQEPQLKPRMDNRLRVFENTYTCFEDVLKEIEDYDAEMQTYYDLRNVNRRLDSFSDQVVTKFMNVNLKRLEIIKVLEDQGFFWEQTPDIRD